MNLEKKSAVLLLIIILFSYNARAEMEINEIIASCHASYLDENMDNCDWFELYNDSEKAVNLKDFKVSDKNNYAEAWTFPDTTIEPKSRITVFASNKDSKSSGAYIMESSGWGIGQSYTADGIRFDYIEIEGDFEIQARFNSMRFVPRGAEAALMLREELNESSKYAAVICESPELKGYRLLFRSEAGELPGVKYFWNCDLVYPSYLIKLKRKGDSLLGFKMKDGVHWDCEARISLPINQDKAYLGVSFSSGDFDTNSKLAISELKINGKEFSPENFKHFEINCGSQGRSYFSRELHTDFKLNKQAESLFLWNADGELIDEVPFANQTTDISYGRYPDGADNFEYFTSPTPESKNEKGYAGKTPVPIFSNNGGWFSGGTSITLNCSDQDAEIYYTTDGSEPDNESNKYTGEKINIDTTTVIRARAFKEDYIQSDIVSNTYFIDEDIPLRTISLTADPEDLWNERDGIFIEENLFSKKEIPVNFELWREDKKLKYETGAGAKVHGHTSRLYPQKSLRLYARSVYGDRYFDYPFFEEKGLEKYNHIIFRNGGTEWERSIIRDAVCMVLAERFPNLDGMAFNPAILFFNGQYWGVQNIRERIHEDYLHLKHDIPTNTIDFFEDIDILLYGDAKELYEMYDGVDTINFSESGTYDFIDKNIDVNNLIEYALMQIYASNIDWPHKNLKYWRSDSMDGKWRWILNDLDWTFGIKGQFDMLIHIAKSDDCSFSKIFIKFLKNEKFRRKFINISSDFMNSVLLPKNVVPIIDSLAGLIRPSIARHQARWDSAAIDWENEIVWMKKFADERIEFLLEDYVDFFDLKGVANLNLEVEPANAGTINVNKLTISQFPWEGVYFQNIPVEFKAVPREGWQFDGWVCEGLAFPDSLDEESNPNISIALPDSIEIKAKFVEGIHQYEGIVVINEIMYKSPDNEYDSKDWIELYNAGDSDLDIGGWKIKDEEDAHVFTFAPGTVIDKNEYLVICRDINNFESVHPDVEHYDIDFTFGFGPNDAVRLYDLDDQLVDKVEYDSNTPWPAGCLETGRTMELTNHGLDNSLPENWRASYEMNGTPGRRNSVYIHAEEYATPSKLKMKVYPNPASETINISFQNPDNGFASIEIRDILGNEIYNSGDRYFSAGRISETLNISDFKNFRPGLYLISVKTRRERASAKIVVTP